MNQSADRSEYLLEFFKALADERRLQIIGLLAGQDYSVEELAAILELSPATTSHHLRRLLGAGLVTTRAEQHYHIYSLDLEKMRQRSQQILSRDALQETAEELDLDAYDRKVLRDFMVDGRLRNLPSQWKKRQVIHRYLANQFQPERQYAEREVNEIISRTHEDYATLRREMVDTGLLAREREVYWRLTG